MRHVHIKQKLKELDVNIESINFGKFDHIGEFCAKRWRDPQDVGYAKYGAVYRSNYERGILVYHMIRKFNMTSLIEVGTGRGYVTFCAAMAFHDAGIAGKIVTIDPNPDEKFFNALTNVFPQDWFSYVHFRKGTSDDVLPTINEKFDFAYIDGDHSYEATKRDWLNLKSKFNVACLFDDYHLPSKIDPGIQCREAIDEIDENEINCTKELLILDRRLFIDERGFTDEQINYGQVLLTNRDKIQTLEW